MKKLYMFALSLAVYTSAKSQVVFSSSFENWASSLPTDWVGVKTTIEDDSIIQVTTGTTYGSSAVQLVNTESTHKRFTSMPVQTDSGSTYSIKLWAKGLGGQIRTTLYDGRASASGYASYTAYDTLTASWELITSSFLCTHSDDSAEFVISVRFTNGPDHIQIDSFVVEEVIVVPSAARPIYDIQYTTNVSGDSPLKDSTVTITGIVTATRSTGYYLQDAESAWSGVFVYDVAHNPIIGDSLTISGTVAEYYNTTQVGFVTSYANHGSVAFVNAVPVGTTEANSENYEGVLVEIWGTCTELPSSTTFGMFTITNGASVKVDDFLYAYTPSLSGVYIVAGIADYSFSERKILPRDANDIQVITGINDLQASEIQVYPNPVADVLTLKNVEQAKATLYNTLGEVMYSGVINNTFDMSAFPQGLYILELNTVKGVFQKQIIKN